MLGRMAKTHSSSRSVGVARVSAAAREQHMKLEVAGTGELIALKGLG